MDYAMFVNYRLVITHVNSPCLLQKPKTTEDIMYYPSNAEISFTLLHQGIPATLKC